MHILPLAFLLALAPPCFAASETWIVSSNACPQVDFESLQTAIDVAADGDTIIVRVSGLDVGSFDIAGKSLTLIGDRLAGYPEKSLTLDGTVRDLLPGQAVTIRGLHISDGLILSNNMGNIWIEDSTISAPEGIATKSELVRVDNSLSAIFIRCNWFQPIKPPAGASPQLGGGQRGMTVVQSEVHLFDCVSLGAAGRSSVSLGAQTTDGGKGGTSLRVRNSIVNAVGSSFEGGIGGFAASNGTLPLCGSGGDGGGGIFVADTASVVRLLDSTTKGGNGGKKNKNGLGTCFTGAKGKQVFGPGVGNVVVLPGSSRSVSLEQDGVIHEFESTNLVVEGEPGDNVFWSIGLVQNHEYLPDFSGTSALDALSIVNLGLLPPSGKLKIPITIADFTSPGQALTVFTQGFFFDSNMAAFASSPASAVIVDSSASPFDGCKTTFYVDDDASGDPGPGDPLISDPLEDGSLLRPYDTIQEAVNRVEIIGSSIILLDGIYHGPGNTEIDPPRNTHMRIASENGPENCVVLGIGSNNIFIFDNPSDVRADGLFGIRVAGAGATAIAINAGSPTIENCVIEENLAFNGAGISVLNGASPLISRCRIRNNFATNRGGGMIIINSLAEIRNCEITNNTALNVGGGIATGGGVGFEIYNSTIANNVGTGVDLRSTTATSSPLLFANCMIWGNTGGPQIQFRFGVVKIQYGNIQDGLAGIDSTAKGTVIPGPVLAKFDPQFVDPSTGDYHLSPGSPFIDAGDPNYVPVPGEKDIDGEPRVQGGGIDMGADEN